MYGILEKIWENRNQKGDTYWTLIISEQRYSVWDADLLKGVQEGDKVEFSFTQSGQYRKIVELHKASMYSPARNRWLDQQERKGKQIVRMSCLRTAAQLVESKRLDPTKKAALALRIAAGFEEHVLQAEARKLAGKKVGK